MSVQHKNHDDDGFALEDKLLMPYTYLTQIRGKHQFGLRIPFAFNHWLQVPKDKLYEVLHTVDTLQNASLLIDDIQDNSNIRRGMPATHCVYGVPLTFNSALHIIGLVYRKYVKSNIEAAQIISEQIVEECRGQGSEIYWRDNFICPTEEEYLTMVKQKTGARFGMTILLMQLHSENKTDFSTLISLLGRYYQIRDDYCNLIQEEALEEWLGAENVKTQKANTFCEDITEGKFTLPIIHAIKTSKGDEIMMILRKRTSDIDLKAYCLSLLEQAGSMQYTRDMLEELDREIRNEVARLGDNPIMTEILNHLLSWKK